MDEEDHSLSNFLPQDPNNPTQLFNNLLEEDNHSRPLFHTEHPTALKDGTRIPPPDA